MHTTLEHLEQYIKPKKRKRKIRKIAGELKVFIIILMIVFLSMTVFTNAEMFIKVLSPSKQEINFDRNQEVQESKNIKVQNNIGYLDSEKGKVKSEKGNTNLLNQEIQNTYEKQIDTLIEQHKNQEIVEKIDPKDNIESQLKKQIKEYSFDFNTLPPENRLVIEKIGLDVPLIDSKFKNKQDFTDGNFDTELSSGVVKYPTTPDPGKIGNTLIFGHTSQERWKRNYYSTVFIGLTDMEKGDIIDLIREGELHEYKVVEKSIVYPSKVNEEYNKYNDGDYITLMGCYPIGKSSKRLLVVAKRVS